MNEPVKPVPPGQVPTLTEVVEFEATEPAALDVVVSEGRLPVGASVPQAGTLEMQTLVERVLADVQRQLDQTLDYRLREALTPVLVRLADGVVREARQQLSITMKDAVAKAVAQEVARQRRR